MTKNEKEYDSIITEYADMLEDSISVDIPDGWLSMVRELLSKLKPLNVNIAQIKEKFGSLRVHINFYDNDNQMKKAEAIIREYEIKSTKICIRCGKSDEPMIRTEGYIMYFCKKCYKE